MTRRDGQVALRRVAGVDVAHWDPLRRTGRWGQPVWPSRPVRNVGDLLGPVVVRELVRQWALPRATDERRRLLAVGSIVHFARPGDVVWGAGRNPKSTGVGSGAGADVRAVRGPLTASDWPDAVVGGDPALLLGGLRPDLVVPADRRSGVTIVPNLNELAGLARAPGVLAPRGAPLAIVRRIARSRLVVGSSLHGIVIAEALGVPARAVRSIAEPGFKYADHYRATGRDPEEVVARSVAEAVARGGAPPPVWDPEPLLRAFPADLWGAEVPEAGVATVAARTREAAGRSRRTPRKGATSQARGASFANGGHDDLRG